MPQFFHTTIELLSHFTGGRGGISHDIVQFGLGAMFWAAILIAALLSKKHGGSSREKLLVWGFGFGFGREIIMLLITLLQVYGAVRPELLNIIFPPLERTIFDIAVVLVASAFMRYLINDKQLAKTYLQAGVTLILICYLATFWWWGKFILSHPDARFGQTWCDWLFRVNASILLAFAILTILRNTSGWTSNWVCAGLTCFFLNEFLKLPDLAFGEVYEYILAPVRHALYMGGIPVFGYVYVRELYENNKKTESALQASQKRYKDLFEKSSDAIYSTDLAGKFIDANPMVLTLFGYSEDDLTNLNAERLYTDKAVRKQLQEEVAQKGAVRDFPIELCKKDGTRMDCLVTTTARYDEDDNVTGYQGIIRDVTMQKRFEKQIRQTEKMEAMGTLAGGIAHDFNNILTAILGYAFIAERELPQDSPSQKSMKEIIAAGNRAKDLVKQILAFSRRDAQEKKSLQLSVIIKEALRLLRATTPASIDIKSSISTKRGVILADPTQILQLLLNLSTNAVHAMKEKGVLEIVIADSFLNEEALAHQPGTMPGEYVMLSVADTGIGMDKNTIDRIFDPFFTTKEVGEGTGMGLSVVHGIVKNHQGMVTVESNPGQGSTFKVYFPLASQDTALEEIGSQYVVKGKEHILFVDDEKTIAKLAKLTLEQYGYEVTELTSSNKALQLFSKNPDLYDLVITDMSMPELSGEELVQEIVKIKPTIPIILCTGYSAMMSEEKAKEMGVKEFVLKPIVEKKLAQIVRKALQSPEG